MRAREEARNARADGRSALPARVALAVVGSAGIGFGFWLLISSQAPNQWVNALVWLAAVVIVHDGVLMPLVSVRRFARERRRVASE